MDEYGLDDLDDFSDVADDDEEAREEIEKLRAAGVFLAGADKDGKKSKSKAKHVPSSGHVVFAETRDESELNDLERFMY